MNRQGRSGSGIVVWIPVFGYHPTVIVGVDCIRIHTDEYV